MSWITDFNTYQSKLRKQRIAAKRRRRVDNTVRNIFQMILGAIFKKK